MTRSLCVLILTLAGGGRFAALAADQTVVFRSDVSLVRVDAQVVDRDNRAITGLHIDDFLLREEGKPQQIRNFGTENMPLDVLLLLDVSASMRPHVQRIASAANQAMRVLGNQDRVGIMVFDRSTRIRMQFHSNRFDVEDELNSLLDQETFQGGTDITRALLDAAAYVQRDARREARRAIVILTDDQTEFDRNEAAVSRALTRADAVLSALIAPDAMHSGYGQPGGMGRGGSWPGGGGGMGGPLGGIILGRGGPYGGGRRGGPGMRGPRTHSAGTSEIARRSGGDSMSVDGASALEDTLARLRQRYALNFYLPAGVKPGEERHIEVALSDAARSRHPGAEVRYRQTYMAPSGAGFSAPPAGGEPVVVTRDSSDTPERSVAQSPAAPRRRVSVEETESHQGPLVGGSDTAQPANDSTRSAAPAAPAQPPSQAAPAAANPAPNTQAPQGGWRKLKPGEQP